MPNGILLPVLILIAVLVCAVFVLIANGRNKKLMARIETLAPAEVEPTAAETAARTLRLHASQRSPFLQGIAGIFRIPLDLPGANIVPPWQIIALGMLLGGVSFFGIRIYAGGPLGGLAGAVIGLLLTRGLFGMEISRYQGLLRQQLPDAIELVVSVTRAGLPVTDALRSVAREMPAPTRDEFARVANEIAVGAAPDTALLNVQLRTGVAEFAIFAVTIGVQGRSGGRLAETVQNLAETIRYRLAMQNRASALSGEARVSALILGGLPVVAGILLSLIRPGYLDPLFHDPRGENMLLIALIGMVLGGLTMRRMIRKATAE